MRKRYLGTLAYALAFTMLISTAVSAAVTTVEFADPNLRAAVSQAVGGRLGLLWAKDVQDLTVLNADLRGVFSLDGIEQLAELKRISLIGNKVACIEPLLALKNLEFVDLRFNDSLDVSVGSSAERVIATLTERGCQVYWGVTAMCVEYTPYGGSSSLLTECDGELPGIWPLIWASVTDQSQSCHLTASEQAITLHVAEIRQPHPPLGGVFRLCPKEGVPPLDAEWEAVKNAGPWTVAAGTKGIVVLVHGWSSNHERLTPYARELGGEWTVYGFDYARDQRISDTGAALASLLDRRVPPGQKVHIVAHSMGGLVARSAIEQHGAAAHVDTLITLGTPHSGMPIEYILNGHELYLQALAFYDSRVEDPGASNVTRLASRMGRDLFVSETAHRKPFGLDVLDMCGLTSFLADLNAESPVGTVYYQIAGDRHPSLGKRERGFVDVMGELSGWFAHSIYDLQLPDEKPTDGVVPLRSALLDLSGEQIDGMHLVWDQERTFTFPVDHGSFYKSPEAMALMKRILGGGGHVMHAPRLAVRRATLDDAVGIRGIHADCDDPWSHPGVGPVWVNHRLLRGFEVDVATVGEKIVGHAEWNVSDEPAPYGRYLYLGMLQVHREYQRRGVGQAMVEAGVTRARSLRCELVKTIPEPEACGFYAKCGFEPVGSITAVDLEVVPRDLPDGWSTARCVPQGVVASLPFRLGWSGQASSAFMWEICNRPVRVAGEEEQHPCAQLSSGQAYVQLRYVGGHGALAVAWADHGIPLEELAHVAQGLTALLSVDSVTISVAYAESNELAKMTAGAPSRTAEIWARDV